MASRGWRPFPFQEEVWDAFLRGDSGLLHAATGSGKTLAAAGGVVMEALRETSATGGAGASAAAPRDGVKGARPAGRQGRRDGAAPPLTLLWLTPLRALARDTADALREVVQGVGLPWSVELRTGDTAPGVKARQRRTLPTVLVTTPESLSLLLTHPEGPARFGGLRAVVVDEWHELLGTKRGVQAELALARLRRFAPRLRTWGISATLGNPGEAAAVLLGGKEGVRVEGPPAEPPEVETLLPPDVTRFPRAGHLGLALLPGVLERLDGGGGTTLLFTNTRYQAEQWHRALREARPGWGDGVELHHGSLDRGVRERVEERIRAGTVRVAVCTSTLDLGVDFPPVERVIQVGSPRGVARLLQRAGRSGHRPGARSRILCVPTHALELAEFGAARAALAGGRLEGRHPLEAPLDVLAQHLVTVALGGGFREDELRGEVRSTHAYRGLSDDRWRWALDFVVRGGRALRAYPRYSRVVPGADGVYRVESREVARMHRAQVGTITSDAAMEVRFLRGGRLGTVEESFLARLRPGDRFLFGGRALELVRVREMTAFVRVAAPGAGIIPRWSGGRLPLSSELGSAMLRHLAGEEGTAGPSPERRALGPLLELQGRWSRVPAPGVLLVERTRTREGHHLFLYPFEGRLVHEGLASLLAWRLTRREPRTVRVSANDYGLELVSRDPLPAPGPGEDPDGWRALLDPGALAEDLIASVNAAELARRRFREVARVSGLLFTGYPGRGKGTRQLQASGGLLYDVLDRYDPGNLLLEQSRREVLEEMLELGRLAATLERLAGEPVELVDTPRLTPFAFPIWAERMQAEVSSESWVDRVRRMEVRLERAASRGRTRGAAAPMAGEGSR